MLSDGRFPTKSFVPSMVMAAGGAVSRSGVVDIPGGLEPRHTGCGSGRKLGVVATPWSRAAEETSRPNHDDPSDRFES